MATTPLYTDAKPVSLNSILSASNKENDLRVKYPNNLPIKAVVYVDAAGNFGEINNASGNGCVLSRVYQPPAALNATPFGPNTIIEIRAANVEALRQRDYSKIQHTVLYTNITEQTTIISILLQHFNAAQDYLFNGDVAVETTIPLVICGNDTCNAICDPTLYPGALPDTTTCLTCGAATKTTELTQDYSSKPGMQHYAMTPVEDVTQICSEGLFLLLGVVTTVTPPADDKAGAFELYYAPENGAFGPTPISIKQLGPLYGEPPPTLVQWPAMLPTKGAVSAVVVRSDEDGIAYVTHVDLVGAENYSLWKQADAKATTAFFTALCDQHESISRAAEQLKYDTNLKATMAQRNDLAPEQQDPYIPIIPKLSSYEQAVRAYAQERGTELSPQVGLEKQAEEQQDELTALRAQLAQAQANEQANYAYFKAQVEAERAYYRTLLAKRDQEVQRMRVQLFEAQQSSSSAPSAGRGAKAAPAPEPVRGGKPAAKGKANDDDDDWNTGGKGKKGKNARSFPSDDDDDDWNAGKGKKGKGRR